jgi:hypothetical protein
MPNATITSSQGRFPMKPGSFFFFFRQQPQF